jgi:hypothetical protein
VDAGHGRIDWGDAMEEDPLFALVCHWSTTYNLHIEPNRRTS